MKHALQRLFKLRKALVMHRGFGCGSEGAALVHNRGLNGVRNIPEMYRSETVIQCGNYGELTYHRTKGDSVFFSSVTCKIN